jgi:hypothetical protein
VLALHPKRWSTFTIAAASTVTEPLSELEWFHLLDRLEVVWRSTISPFVAAASCRLA